MSLTLIFCLPQMTPDNLLCPFSEPVRRLAVLSGRPARVVFTLLGSLDGIVGHVPMTWVWVKQTEVRGRDQPRPASRESWAGSLTHQLTKSHCPTKSHHPPLCLSFVPRERWLLRNHVCTRKYFAQLSDPKVFSPF